MSQPSSLKLLYHLNFQDVDVLKQNLGKFHCLVINANTIAYASYRVKQFLHEIECPFVIDPMTYVFGFSLDAIRVRDEETEKLEDLRLSYGNLAKAYGGPFLECLKLSPVNPPMFLRSPRSTEAVKNIIAFQRNLPGSDKSIARYRRFREKRQLVEELRPSFLLAPYFHFSSIDEPWYRVSLGLSLAAKSFRGDLPLFAVLCPSQDCLQSVSARDRIVKDYTRFDGVLIWVPGLRDDNSSLSKLSSLTELVRGFSSYGKPVIMLHAGYYGALLAKTGLTGFSSGLCYGESKALGSGAGRLPSLTKYYIPQIHLLRPVDVATLFYGSDINAVLLCRCPTCISVRTKTGHSESQRETREFIGHFFQTLTLEEAQSHFMNCRFKEGEILDGENKPTTLQRLKAEYDFVSGSMNPPPETTLSNHFARWIAALS